MLWSALNSLTVCVSMQHASANLCIAISVHHATALQGLSHVHTHTQAMH